MGQVTSLAPDYAKAKVSAAQVFATLDQIPLIDNMSTEGEQPEIQDSDPRGPLVSFKSVTFEYPQRPGQKIVSELSFDIPWRQRICICGTTGSGKSTIFSLLLRLYDINAGEINFRNKDIRQFNINWWRSQISIVTQEPTLFGLSIADNIRYGKPDATDEEVEHAARLAHIHDFIVSQPDGYKTQCGRRGVSLSGGQRQRIAIARAILLRPQILLLDEATSALSSQDEEAVQRALDEVSKLTTTIIIAHRLSSIRSADHILVLDSGKVAESGTFDQLVSHDGPFSQIVRGRDQHA